MSAVAHLLAYFTRVCSCTIHNSVTVSITRIVSHTGMVISALTTPQKVDINTLN